MSDASFSHTAMMTELLHPLSGSTMKNTNSPSSNEKAEPFGLEPEMNKCKKTDCVKLDMGFSGAAEKADGPFEFRNEGGTETTAAGCCPSSPSTGSYSPSTPSPTSPLAEYDACLSRKRIETPEPCLKMIFYPVAPKFIRVAHAYVEDTPFMDMRKRTLNQDKEMDSGVNTDEQYSDKGLLYLSGILCWSSLKSDKTSKKAFLEKVVKATRSDAGSGTRKRKRHTADSDCIDVILKFYKGDCVYDGYFGTFHMVEMWDNPKETMIEIRLPTTYWDIRKSVCVKDVPEDAYEDITRELQTLLIGETTASLPDLPVCVYIYDLTWKDGSSGPFWEGDSPSMSDVFDDYSPHEFWH